ncbi:MAG: ABC transporter permease [Rhizobiales bacterium]|nr:ABC transporter permease [Hyphomicrobiales bacterium]MBO6699175.1 ABC transporter permease [Hyphomicrobiales bacterium]MBO6736713.1 ABC transporter permease [Hyphomicrobiales bacterium]MBO6912213.1 ABC transporter permease [Hyphomicrobiales bacterium]MBO6956216.1 ABC transporter permease [Hyphomicrobiales bacterium]
MESFQSFILLLDSTVRLSMPLLFAALAGLYSERSGIFDIGLEGKMLAAAFAAAAIGAVTGNVWLGLMSAIAVSILLALVHGFACITARGNQIVSGVAINFLAAGLTALIGHAYFQRGGRTPGLDDEARFTPIVWPAAEALQDVPIIGPIYFDLVSGHNLLVYVGFLAVAVTWFVVFRTRFGLRLRAVGENPAAVDTAGISVTLMRYQAVIICGLLCGLAGAYLSTAQSASFVPNMSAGKGFIALAALIFAKWKPIPVLYACLLFGFLEALGIVLQGRDLPLIGEVPVQIVQALPYILTVVLLAGFIGRADPPKAGGVPYVKER